MRCWQLDILGVGIELHVRAAPAFLDVLDDAVADLVDRSRFGARARQAAVSDGPASARRSVVLDLDAATLTDGAELVASGFVPEDAQEWLWWHLNRVGALHPVLTTVHAGVVANSRGAVVIPGSAGAGKSTLTAALVGAGWRYLSDELAALSRGAALVHPYPRPLSLHPTSVRLLAVGASGATAVNGHAGALGDPGGHVEPGDVGEPGDHGHPGRPEFVASRRLRESGDDTSDCRAATSGTSATGGAPVAPVESVQPAEPVVVVFPRFAGPGRAAERVVEPLGPADTLVGLIANGSNLAVNGQRAFSTLAALAARAPGFVVDTTDLVAAVETVAALVARAQAPGGPELMARPPASVVEVRRGPRRGCEVHALAWPQDTSDLVLFDAATSQTHRLNGAAAEVWLRCDGNRSVEQITHELAEYFPGADIALQARSVIDRLVELGAVELTIGTPGHARRSS